MEIQIPYGRSQIRIEIPRERIFGIIRSRLDTYVPSEGEQQLIQTAMRNPVQSKPLCELAKGKRRAVIIASDHTRPIPSRLIMPELLQEIRKGNPDAEITILIATGCHRASTKEELTAKFGEKIMKEEQIVIHDGTADMAYLGRLPSGGELWIHPLAAEADLLVSEGFIEPHFFAGFSGGRKSVLPGIAGRTTVYANHCAELIQDVHSRCGKLEGNRIHQDMVFAARKAGLAYILNVVINSAHQVVGAFAGDMEAAHEKGAAFLTSLCGSSKIEAEIVVTSNNGYPLDQNLYQAVKGMSTAEYCVKEGGVIILFAECADGHGGEHFYQTFQSARSAEEVLEKISGTSREDTKPDQWQSQILARILHKCQVILVSSIVPKMVRDFHMIPAKTFEEALEKAEAICGQRSRVLVIPEGVTTMFV